MEELARDAKWFQTVVKKAVENISNRIIGKRRELELIIAAILAEGHVLLEGVPGVAKTLLARSIAETFDLEFRRIQATPDLLPTDIIGAVVFDQASGEFRFKPGPVFTNMLLVDEINRAPPKTQSALLEAMQERQVTVEGKTHPLPKPFIVIATMNPIEIEGTFPLSEAQVDRFLARIVIGYPSLEETIEILRRYDDIMSMRLRPIVTREEVEKAIGLARRVYVDENLLRYIAAIVEETRKHPMVRLGASPRGAIALYTLSRAMALVRGRSYVTPDDVKYVAHAALSHRIILRSEARMSGIIPENVIDDVLEKVEPP